MRLPGSPGPFALPGWSGRWCVGWSLRPAPLWLCSRGGAVQEGRGLAAAGVTAVHLPFFQEAFALYKPPLARLTQMPLDGVLVRALQGCLRPVLPWDVLPHPPAWPHSRTLCLPSFPGAPLDPPSATPFFPWYPAAPRTAGPTLLMALRTSCPFPLRLPSPLTLSLHPVPLHSRALCLLRLPAPPHCPLNMLP